MPWYVDMKISILIPCYNEEKTIARCLESCLNQSRPADEILVVDDASTDRSPEILTGFGDRIKVVRLAENSGNKSRAQEAGLKYIQGDIFIATDGDTILDRNFVKRVEDNFKDEEIAAVAGYVRSLKENWLTACRALDYFVSQNIHKVAQSHLRAIYVIPGCAAAFKKDIFEKYVGFDHDNITEDIDFTYKLNENNLRIKYDPQMIVYTQDPADLASYIKQMRRWYGGGWQNLVKHWRSILSRPACIFELSIIYLEGLFFPLLTFLLLLFNFYLFFSFLMAIFALLIVFAGYGAIKEKRFDFILYIPFYIFIQYLDSFIFLEQFLRIVILKRGGVAWHKLTRREINA